MDFQHTEEQQMLADMLRRFLAEHCPAESRHAVAYNPPFHDPDTWKKLTELGVLGALVHPEHGGFGGSGEDIALVFEELGRALCTEPMLGALLSLRMLIAGDRSPEIEDILSGANRFALAWQDRDDSPTKARRTEAGKWLLTGRKTGVLGATGDTRVLVTAQAEEAVGLFSIESGELHAFGMIDGGPAAELVLAKTPADCLLPDAGAALQAALDDGRVALCAEALGAMDVLLNMTIDYLLSRKQFGRPLATFQALQHRVVDLAVEVEQCRSITTLAAGKLESEERARVVSMAKYLVGRTARLVAEEAIQMHGAIGMTWEYPGSHFAKRLVMIDHALGSADEHLYRFMAAGSEQH